MSAYKGYERIEPVSGVGGGSGVKFDPTDAAEAAQKSKFDIALEQADPTKVEKREVLPPPTQVPQDQPVRDSVMDLAKTSVQVPKVATNPSDISSQAAQLRKQLSGAAQTVEKFQKSSIPPTETTKLNSFIEHIDQGLRDVTKLVKGVEVGALKGIEGSKPPMVRFLSYLTDSDTHLSKFMDELGGLKIGQQKLSPDVLLAVQVKLSFISQELDFFTTTLSKALESTKTVMNVQI